MLQKLIIRNYAIIEDLEISFPKGLNILTGETGAGKSIIMGALGLILGERADSSVLVKKEKKSVVEGWFDSKHKEEVHEFLQANELDITDELVIRREISPNGKSRAFINDTPVTLVQLNNLSSLLVDLHQQFDTLSLGETDFQLEVIDALAGHGKLLQDFSLSYDNWSKSVKELAALQEQKDRFDREADYNRFQFNELEEAGFGENELEDAEAELKVLANAEGIKATLDKVYAEMEEGEMPLVQRLKSLLQVLQPYTSYHAGLAAILQRMNELQVELKDVAGEIDSINSEINYDPEKINQLNERLSLGYKLQKKHGAGSTADLLRIQADLEKSLQAIFDIGEHIVEKQKEVDERLNRTRLLAEKLSAGRKKQLIPFQQKVNALLVRVGMPNARTRIEMKETALNPSGKDAIDFLFDANIPVGAGEKAGQYQSIKKVASGGELSRLMLCIKSLVAQSMDLPTMIFDEIDTGISGEAARQVGVIMKELAAARQVICITHQPQIAGKADAHYFVYKEIVKDSVKTNIRLLDTEERITAIARMLSGEKPTAAAMENAREMVRN